MERLRSKGWTLPAMVEKVGSNPARSFFFAFTYIFQKGVIMKTVIGFVCGVVGLVFGFVMFVLGIAFGFKLGISDKVTVEKKEG